MPSDCPLSGLQLLRAGVADCALLAEIAAAATDHPWSRSQYRDSVRAGHQCWLLRRDQAAENIAACVLLQRFDQAEILDLAVVPAWRRRGIAQALLHRLLGQLPAEVGRVLLEVRASNAPARHLYQALGFAQDGVRKRYYPTADGDREDAVLMSLFL
ncbi:ribosomal protein S18-alanine N-acetyltransferase [Microbulbifer sp. TYP-18]|uniref:ribosomal protein S18-alanine N-acetyltransferase n=1 Tax=Microbulbifer sp. TYP-18 TaxID=3230024 RepID=UPI0034C6137A